jgi:hypothetical protein
MGCRFVIVVRFRSLTVGLTPCSRNIPRPTEQQIPGLVPYQYPSDSVTTNVRKDSILRHW